MANTLDTGGSQTLLPTESHLSWPRRVLIVDDAASTRRLLRAVLEAGGFDVAGEADNGSSAIEQARELQPDVVLLDICMPGADGSSALSGLLQAAPNARVIVLSGMDPKRVAAPLLEGGATGFVPKGLPPFELLDRIATILDTPSQGAVTSGSTVPDSRPAADPATASARQHPRGVVCEDNAMTRRLVSEVLESCDVDVIAATETGPNLLSVVDLAQPDIVVLDLWLPGTPGLTLLPELHKRAPRAVVIVYSAYEESKDTALAAGAAAFVAKPHFDELAERIRRLYPSRRP